MRLSLRTRKRCLWMASTICILITPLVALWGFRPLESRVAGAASTFVPESQDERLDNDSQLLASNESDPGVWSKQLRRPLYDPPPPPPPKKKPPPPLGVSLLGTILEPGNSRAIISSAGGKVEYKRVGDSIGPTDSPAEIIEILGDSVVVRRGDESTTLRRKE